MNRDRALELVKKQITEQRYKHTLGVVESAIWLADKYGADRDKAEFAAIFHDYAKFRPKDEMKQIIAAEGMPLDLLDYNMELWHAPVGAYLVEKEAGIKDIEILNAIRYHTSGRENMSLLEKVIYLADYIEPGRSFPGVDEVRKTASEQLDSALTEAMRNTIIFLMNRNQSIYPATFKAYNYLIMNKEESA
ncbi:putative HD superfamily hydrolase involved in NAD metabolism [Peribacillus deserti]|uniref:bis(5'-nucleosyl)-tetraphosphatase (symmetrical) n=1 Tax=Peribacillus deserti TaxID=673318 RepID=A0ABS2QFA9_9BACI|nr:bis(5'-nucleosyl)-tetraphosphatase (symmetrical) YqeK [Peribacillus deserti]MBM7691837.1 putative HD superfamily hydrolase involved in NAD metabolism [Peribacillus deserti]